MIPPLYKKRPPIKQPQPIASSSYIDLNGIAPATSVADANNKFDARAAAAIHSASMVNLFDPLLPKNSAAYGVAVLAKCAYADYFEEPPNKDPFRQQVADSLIEQTPGTPGTGGDYDFVLNLYIPLAYQYYNDLQDYTTARDLPRLLSVVQGSLGSHESEHVAIPDIGTYIPETENHLFLIETARYLNNQILYQQIHSIQYDNRRNGNGMDPPATAVWLLYALQSILQHDFAEYNARPYQDNIMMALLNLESYAYDYDVRLGARMALDYISAKVAVSSNDLRRAPPFRRRNEDEHFGPTISGSWFLRSPLLVPNGASDYPDLPGQVFEPDPQGCWYAMLAGNTGMLPCSRAPTDGPGSFSLAMVFAGIHDYRVPDLILDLFVNPTNRYFYQRFQHSHSDRDAGTATTVNEIYAASPSYLISAGGHPTGYCYSSLIAGIPEIDITSMTDLGSAMPTIFMPTGSGLTLESMIQFGQYTTYDARNDPVKYHLGVAPDFACGASVFRTGEINNADPSDQQGAWTFLNNGNSGNNPGYYLALYDGSYFGDPGAVLEAYDTWLNPVLSFDQFKSNVLELFGSTRFSVSGTNSYVTQSGQEIKFTIAPQSEIISSSWLMPAFGNQFAYGRVINSSQGSGIIKISNPGLPGAEITLDMSDAFHPTRISETGNVERAGWDTHEEVWVDVNSPAYIPSGPDGDFYHPFKTLAEAVAAVADGGTIKMVPGTAVEALIPGIKRMRLVAPIGGVTISAP